MIRTESEIEEIINRMIKGWFFNAPYLYKKICINPVYKNKIMACEARSGKNRIEYNPDLLMEKTPGEIKDLIKLELARIILGHCTFRRPNPFNAEIAIKASNMAILQTNLEGLPEGESFEFYYDALMKRNPNEEEENNNNSQNGGSGSSTDMEKENGGNSGNSGDGTSSETSSDIDSEESDEKSNDTDDESDEKSSGSRNSVQGENKNNSDSENESENNLEDADSDAGNDTDDDESDEKSNDTYDDESEKDSRNSGNAAQDAVELWNKDDAMAELKSIKEIQDLVENEEELKQVNGLLPDNEEGNLLSSLVVYSKKVSDRIIVLKIFMDAIKKGNKRIGTRTKPNRRFGYIQLGTKRDNDKLSLLCVLDVSGSVSDEWLVIYSNYLNYIKRKYKCEMYVVEADTKIKENTLFKMKSDIEMLECEGRGGTDFQCVIDYVAKEKSKYDGVIIFTDGYVNYPVIPPNFNTRFLWAINKRVECIEESFKDAKYVVYLEE